MHPTSVQGAEASRLLPRTRRHDPLRAFAGCQVDPEPDVAPVPILDDGQRERRARVPVPHLCGVDPVPVRNLTGPQQEVDGGGGGAVRQPNGALRIAEGLSLMPAFGMWAQFEKPDDRGGSYIALTSAL